MENMETPNQNINEKDKNDTDNLTNTTNNEGEEKDLEQSLVTTLANVNDDNEDLVQNNEEQNERIQGEKELKDTGEEATTGKYTGQLLHGKADGKGIWICNESKDKYDGEYVNDKKEGQGTYTWIEGDKYEGKYKNDVRSGKGKLVNISGEIYDGEWE